MFNNLKRYIRYEYKYINLPPIDGTSQGLRNFHISSGAHSAPYKGNEADRMVRCRICGFPCDKERDVKSKDGTWAGLGIDLGAQQTASLSKLSDSRSVAAGSQSQNADKYYNRSVTGGCPACGCLTYWEEK